MNVSVCIFSPSQKIWGGGQIYIENLCRYLNSHCTSAKIITPEPESFSCPTILMASVTSKKTRLKEAFTVAKFLRSEGFSIIVLNDLSSLWLAPVFRSYGLKVVSLLHLYLQKKNSAGLGHGWLEYYLLRISSRFVHHIFSVNKENISSFPVNVEFIGNFISSWFFNVPRCIEKKYDLGLIARLSLQKNIPLFVELVARLNEISNRPITALIVGRGEEEKTVRESIKLHAMENLIELKPWVDREELPYLYDQIRCFAITSHHEGFATTLLEAHARGVPAITTRASGYCAEFVESGPLVSGLAFEPADILSSTFLNKILDLIETSSEYLDVCKNKSKLFDEDRVLGRIRDVVLGLSSSD